MKSLSRSLLIGVCALAISFVCTVDASAQRGEKTLGVGGGFATFNQSGYADVYFQYSFSKRVRIAPEVGYIFEHKDKTGFEAAIDVHFPFRVYRGINVYPLTGVSFNNWKFSEGRGSMSRAGLDFGGGLELYLTSNLKVSVQGKYSLLKDSDGGFFNVGFGYVF